jgi:hypothetical protein
MIMDYASEIKSRLTMPQVLSYYGFNINRAKRIPCPLHSGTDANCGVKEHYIHCFVCGESADVIKFTMRHFGLDFQSAISKLNEDFCLGLPIGHRVSLRQRYEMQQRQEAIQAEKERQQAEFDRLTAEYWAAFDLWKKYDTNKREYAPKSPSEDFHPLFVEAVKNIDRAAYELSVAEMRLKDYANNRQYNNQH